LSACVQLLIMKSTLNLTQTAFNKFTEFTRSCMLDNGNLVSNFYNAKKFIQPLGLGYDKYDVCLNYCMLYYGVNAMKTNCDFYGSLRYKLRNLTSKGSNKLEKQLWYFPLIPRLQRLFMSPHYAKDMTWHHFHRSDEGVMVHPSYKEVWKKFNQDHQDFESDPWNIQLGLCIDGFSPFNMSSNVYSCWPVIVSLLRSVWPDHYVELCLCFFGRKNIHFLMMMNQLFVRFGKIRLELFGTSSWLELVRELCQT